MITDANVTVFNRYGYDSFGRRLAVVGKPSLAAPSLEGAGMDRRPGHLFHERNAR